MFYANRKFIIQNCAIKKCQGICSYKRTPTFFSLDNKVTTLEWCHLVTSVEQLKTGANCLTPDGDTLQLFHTSQITIIVDPADYKGGVR